MATPPLSDGTLRASIRAVRTEGSQNKAAAELGISRNTLQHRLKIAAERGIKDEVEYPDFVTVGDEEEPIDDLLNRFRKAHERKAKAISERAWFPIKIKEEKPYGFLWFGDPHLGPDCDWKLLESHLEIARRDGVYGGNIGDLTNNWPWTGKLARLWAEADISSKTERRLALWFMLESGVRWLVWLLGNHDEWNGTGELYKLMGAHRVPMADWRAQFRLVHRNGSETRIDAAHGRKGTSIYNPAHGTLRDAKFGEHADFFVTGHIHSFGLFDIEFPEKKTNTWLAQISGYKIGDRHALVHGFAQSNRGAAVLAVIDPATGKVQCFADVEEGADYLAWRRR